MLTIVTHLEVSLGPHKQTYTRKLLFSTLANCVQNPINRTNLINEFGKDWYEKISNQKLCFFDKVL